MKSQACFEGNILLKLYYEGDLPAKIFFKTELKSIIFFQHRFGHVVEVIIIYGWVGPTLIQRSPTSPMITSLEDLGAATCKLLNFVDHKVQSPLEVLWKSFGSPSVFRNPSEILQKSSTVVASVTDKWTDYHLDF